MNIKRNLVNAALLLTCMVPLTMAYAQTQVPAPVEASKASTRGPAGNTTTLEPSGTKGLAPPSTSPNQTEKR